MKKIFFLSLALMLILTGCTKVAEDQTTNEAENQTEEQEVSQENNEENIQAEEPNNEMSDSSQTYIINTENSNIGWMGSKFTGANHTGTIKIKQGNLSVDENLNITGGEFIIDMTTISDNDGSESLESHLRSDDFFATDMYNEAKITITDIMPDSEVTSEEKTFEITADLTIKDQTHPITFNANASKQNNDTVSANAKFTIDRTKWGVIYGSGNFFKELGDRVINDEIEFEISLEANLSK